MKAKILIVTVFILMSIGGIVYVTFLSETRQKPSDYFDSSKAHTKVGDEERF